MSRQPPKNGTAPAEPDRRLDVTNTLCPIPAIRTARVLSEMNSGQVLEVLATDPMAEVDLAVVCQRGGHELVATNHHDETIHVLIRVRSRPAD